MTNLLCLMICFFIGTLIYILIRNYCGCNNFKVIEGYNYINTQSTLKYCCASDRPSEEKIVGGWCMCSNKCPDGQEEGCNKDLPTWNTNFGSNTIIAGGFMPDGSIGPCRPGQSASCTDSDRKVYELYKNRWLSVGGDGVGSANGGDANACLDNAIDLIYTLDMNGIAFDMEGCLHNNLSAVADWIDKHKDELLKFKSDFKFIFVPESANWYGEYNYKLYPDLFDYIAPMFYTTHTSYNPPPGPPQFFNTSGIDDLIDLWMLSPEKTGSGLAQGAPGRGVPKEKLLLTYTSHGVNTADNTFPNRGTDILKYLAKKVRDEGYPGILGWSEYSSDTPEATNWDNYCLKIIKDIL